MPVALVRPGRVQHICAECGSTSPKWQGRCPACGAWNSLSEEVVPASARRAAVPVAAAAIARLDQLGTDDLPRIGTGNPEVDRVLGGGMVPGSLVLLGGDPGIGKSTLALQLAARLGARGGTPALYCTGEESPPQVAMRARRTGCAVADVEVSAETDLESVLATVTARVPAVAVVDSVQTLLDPAVPGSAGSVSQVRNAVARLLGLSKASGVPILLIGHVTKEGAIAGPRTLEHMVDVVLYLEGDRHGEHRLLRGVKNRFGATGELGVLTMGEAGMEAAAAPSRALLEGSSLGVAGNVLTITCEGIRPLAVEVQALTLTTPFGLPRRTASGFDIGRLHLLLAILEKRGRIPLGQSDVYVNVAGGIRLADPAVDLAVAVAIASAARDRAIPSGTVVFGELGLGGEVRRVSRAAQRLAEAVAVGAERAVIPAAPAVHGGSIACRPVATLGEALTRLS